MAHILVTGGTGVLGREVVARLAANGHTVRIMSRSASRLQPGSPMEWAQADFATGQGLIEAVRHVDIIVNCVSNLFQKKAVDIEGTALLMQHAKAAGISHVVHISIVGIDRSPFSYYKAKLAAEKAVESGGIPWTVLRTTQFYNFIDMLLQPLKRTPFIGLLPTDFTLQPLDVGEVADRLVTCVDQPPAGMLPEMGGPEIWRLGDMAKIWLEAQGLRRLIVHLPLPGGAAEAFRNGSITTPDHRDGKITWPEWVTRTYRSQTVVPVGGSS